MRASNEKTRTWLLTVGCGGATLTSHALKCGKYRPPVAHLPFGATGGIGGEGVANAPGHRRRDHQLTTLLGIEVPSSDPVFLGLVFSVHIPLGLACVVAGATAMLSRKGQGRHPTAGRAYFWCLMALFASIVVLATMRWADDYPLFLFGMGAVACALFGRSAIWFKWPYWTRLHLTGMGSSYALMIAAFYVDNGKQLPVWKDLPPVTYWLLPLAVGAVLIGWALRTHPLRKLGDPQ